MKTTNRLVLCILPLLLLPRAAAQGPPGGGAPGNPPTPVPAVLTVQVDCDAGETIAAALTQRADELTVEITGSCPENVLIRRDRTRLLGVAPGAEIVGDGTAILTQAGVVTVQGASNVTLADLTIRGGNRGITLRDGGHARLERLTVRDNTLDGVFLSGSRAWVEELAILDNGQDGLAAWGSSTVVPSFTGTTVFRRNGRVGLLVSGSSDVAGFGTTRMEIDDSPFGVFVQAGASVQALGLTARRNDFGIVALVGGKFGSAADVRDGGAIGVSVSDGGFADVRGTIENNGAFGIWAEHDATVTFRGEISGHQVGMRLDGTEAFILNSAIDDPVELLFGTRVDFAGGNSLTGGVSCDGTVLVRGDVACPAAASLGMGERVTGEPVAEAVGIELPGPFELEP